MIMKRAGYAMLLLALVSVMALPMMAQDETPSGTPTEICEAATPAAEPETQDFEAPEAVLEADVDYQAIFCTSAGAVYVDLLEDWTPETVNNFVFLAENDYYNGTIFHRVMEDFMAQGGDPTGTGTGGPGYQFADEIVGFLAFDRPGLLAMANAGPGTNGSQFFITTAETPWLNGAHTIFGDVLEGQESVVENIQLRDPEAGGDATTLDTVVIIRDPSVVDSSFEDTTEVATAETFVNALDSIAVDGGLPPDIVFTNSGELDTAAVIETVEDSTQADAYSEFLEQYGHQYRVGVTLDNAECNEGYFFRTLEYTVDAFESAEMTAAALIDPFYDTFYSALGYEINQAEGTITTYTQTVDVCAEGDLAVTTKLQRGRYLATLSVVLPASVVEQIGTENLPDALAQNIVPIFEQTLSAAYASEIR